MNNDKKTPLPPVPPSRTTFKSIEFLGGIVSSLDQQFEFMEKNLCYGRISIEFKFWNGKMTDKATTIIVNDRVVKPEK